MGKQFTNTNIPVTFQKVSQFDSRFMLVKIWLMHTGENYNGSIFTKESVEKAIPSLKNTPILGYIEDNAIGKEDYKGHESELVIEDGDYRFKYQGSAYGVIPETNNARWEKKEGDDGQLREYLVVDGLMWTKFDDAIGIMDRDEFKGQSMELHNEYTGKFNDDGFFVFDDFQFYGACILGDGIEPAMQRAVIEKQFSVNELQKEINSMMEQFKTEFGKMQQKEGDSMTLEELLAKYSISTEDLESKGIVAEDFSIEELEAKISEEFSADGDGSEPEGDETADSSEAGEDNPEEDFQADEGSGKDEDEDPEKDSEDFSKQELPEGKVDRSFALSHEDVRSQLWDKVKAYVEEKQIMDKWDFWISKVYDDNVIIMDETNGKTYRISYSKDSDIVALGEHTEVFTQYLTAEEKGALELMRSNFETLNTEVESLREFKVTKERSEHEAKVEELIAEFALTEDDVKELLPKIHEYSIDDIQEKFFAIVGRKNFSTIIKKEKEKAPKVIVSPDDNKSQSSYSHIFAKHGIK